MPHFGAVQAAVATGLAGQGAASGGSLAAATATVASLHYSGWAAAAAATVAARRGLGGCAAIACRAVWATAAARQVHGDCAAIACCAVWATAAAVQCGRLPGRWPQVSGAMHGQQAGARHAAQRNKAKRCAYECPHHGKQRIAAPPLPRQLRLCGAGGRGCPPGK